MNTQPTNSISEILRSLACLAIVAASMYLCYTIYTTNQTFNALQKSKPVTEVPHKSFYRPVGAQFSFTLLDMIIPTMVKRS
ncbi:hypothetical protein RLOatenuis_0720 [Rickettsiales bacterium]|nr:hypothetical protein RLOatenuis_0720 [Rickettsiales bacterium]